MSVAKPLTPALAHSFRLARHCRLLLSREILAMRLVSISQLIERTTDELEFDHLVAKQRAIEFRDELAELTRLRDELAGQLHHVRQELRK